MPPTTSQSPLFAKYGKELDTAVQKHRTDETNYGLTRLPPGIVNGVAQLTSVKFDTYKTGANKDHYYFQARGVVLQPYEVIVEGAPMKVQGLQTMVQLACCSTKDSNGKVTPIADNVAKVLNEMRKLAGDDFTKGATGANLEALGKALEKARPFFKFSTSVRKARPGTTDSDGVWENWNGYTEYTPPSANGRASTVDQTGTPEITDEEPPTEFNEFGGSGSDDLLSLGAAADAGDGAAAKKLTDMARAAGMTDEEMEAPDLPNWTALAEHLASTATGEEGEPETVEEVAEPEPEATEEAPPKPGEVMKFQQMDPRTGKPPLGKDKKPVKPINVTIVSVDEDNKTVVLKSMTKGADGKALLYKDIPWTRLMEA